MNKLSNQFYIVIPTDSYYIFTFLLKKFSSLEKFGVAKESN